MPQDHLKWARISISQLMITCRPDLTEHKIVFPKQTHIYIYMYIYIYTSKSRLAVDREFMYIGSAGPGPGGRADGRTGGRQG